MKRVHYFLILVLGILGCEKERNQLPVSTPPKLQTALVEFVDHTTGDLIKGQELLFGRYSEVISNPQNFMAVESRLTSSNGTIRYTQSLRPTFLKPNGENYSDIVYMIDGTEPYKNDASYFKKGRFLKNEGGISYYTADLYRKAPVDIHLKQESDLFNTPIISGTLQLNFFGEDPTDSTSIHYLRKEFRIDIGSQITPGKKIDTMFRVYAFGDLENSLYWSIYVQAADPFDPFVINDYSVGSLQKAKFPSSGATSIKLTF